MSKFAILVKPTLFTVGTCGTCFCGATIFEYERKKSQSFSYSNFLFVSQRKYSKFRQSINDWKNNLDVHEKIAYSAIFINVCTYGLWKLKPMRPTMMKFFLNTRKDEKISLVPMILSNYSHSSFIHLSVNMLALYSFSKHATILLGPEQLIGLYVSAGAVASLASSVNALTFQRAISSLGASGALLGVISYICIKEPDTQLLLFAVLPITGGAAIKYVIGLDIIGIISRWTVLDHAAHLGGTLTGVCYALYGQDSYNRYRSQIVSQWIKLKSKFKDD